MTSFEIKSPKLVAIAAAVLVSLGSFSAITTQFQHAGDRNACLTRLADARWGSQNSVVGDSAATPAPRTALESPIAVSTDGPMDNVARVAQSNTKRLSAKL